MALGMEEVGIMSAEEIVTWQAIEELADERKKRVAKWSGPAKTLST